MLGVPSGNNTMAEPTRAATLEDLSGETVLVTVKKPSGKLIEVELRELSEPEVADIRHSIKWPEAPVKDFKKIGSDVVPIVNYQDAGYIKAQNQANSDFLRKLLVKMMVMEIAGETEDEKLATLKKTFSQAVLTQLSRAVSNMIYVGEQEIDNVSRSFRPA